MWRPFYTSIASLTVDSLDKETQDIANFMCKQGIDMIAQIIKCLGLDISFGKFFPFLKVTQEAAMTNCQRT